LRRRLTRKEFEEYCIFIESKGFEKGWIQHPGDVDGSFLPDFKVKEGWN